MQSATSNCLLVISSELTEQQFVQSVLSRYGYQIHKATVGYEGLRLLIQLKPDLLLLNVALPDISGEQLCRRVRNFSDVPILFFVDAAPDSPRYPFANCGLADYLIKPLQPTHLLKQVQQSLQQAEPESTQRQHTRPQPAPEDDTLDLAPPPIDLLIDHSQYQAILQGKVSQLNPVEYRLLTYFINHAGCILTHAQIVEEIWRTGDPARVHCLHTLIWRLRCKIEENPKAPKHLLSHYGIGYSFNQQRVININPSA